LAKKPKGVDGRNRLRFGAAITSLISVKMPPKATAVGSSLSANQKAPTQGDQAAFFSV
jgi:hypothetical protein